MIYDCTDFVEISGEFGGGGGGSAPAPYRPIEANDTLASKQSLKMLFAIADNEIESIDQIYINGTPFSSFEGASHTRLGTLDQTTIPGFEDITTPIAVSVTLTTGIYITRAVSSAVVDAARVTFKLQGLRQVMENGDSVGYAVQLRIDTRPVAGTGTWTTAGTISKSGKASSVYAWDTRVNKPAGATGVWEFRVVRDTAADTSKQASLTVFDSYTEIQDKKLTYPGTALVGLVFTNSEQLGGRIPTVSFDVKGWKMQLPDGAFYNSVTRVYTGNWSGAFDSVYKYSDNPAWFIYNILSTAMDRVINSKTYSSGLGISPSLIDKFSFYELAKYCDESVDDGHGGTEPRFIIANQFYVRENAPTFLAYCLTICNANLTTQNGLITIISDRPTVSTKIVNNSNVIDGDFSYPSSHVNERYTQANVTFNDPDDKSNTRTVSEQASQTLIDRYGFNPIDIVLVGCRSEGQARRKAKWVLEAPTAMIGFSVGLAGAMYNVGEVVEVHDKSFTNLEGQGLVSAATTTQITLDRPVTFGAETYTVIVYAADGVTIQEKIINQQNTTTNIITMTTALATAPAANSPWIIKGVVLPRKFRVSAITREDNEYKIVGTAYDETKYARLEGGIVVAPSTGIFANISEFETPAVSNITFQEFFRNDGIAASNKILVKWDWDVANTQKFQPTYDVIWRRDNLPFQSLPSRQVKEAEILDTTPGIYEVIIYAVNVRGIRSIGTKQTYSYRVNPAQSSLIAPENFWVKSTTAAIYNAADLVVTWTYPLANDAATDTLKDYLIEVWTSDGITLKNTFTIEPNAARGGEFTYLIAQNLSDFGAPTRDVQFKIYSRDLIGDVSVALARVFSNPVPAAPIFTLVSGVGITFVGITPPADLDVTGYIIYRSTTSGFTPGAGNLVYDGPDTYVSLQGVDGTLYYYKVAAYDNFSKTGLNVATQQSSTTLSFDATAWTKTGIVFTANTPTGNTLYWSSGSVIKNGSTTYTISAGSALWSTGTLYAYFNPSVSTTQLQTTTSLATAVATGNYPIATYTGGAATNIKGGDGSAFISGSQIVAGTVGASQLIAGSAVITGSAQIANALINTAHINDAQITDAKIGNTIQSTNYNPATFNGWKIDKAGNLTSYGALALYDGAGNAVLTTGAAAAVAWGKVSGTGKPADGADVTDYADTRVANSILENSILRVAHPLGGSYKSMASSVTGAIKITLPQSWTSTMLSMIIDVYNYAADESFSLEISGYNYITSSTWLSVSARLIGSAASDNRVRFGHDGTKCCIYIGETTSVWSFPTISVRSFTASFTNFSVAQWESGWGVTTTTTIGTITQDLSNTLIDASAVPWSGVNGTGKPADNATVGADFDTNVTNIPYATIYTNDDATALGFNPTFSDWTGTYPANWVTWIGGPTKETSVVRVGKYAVKFVATAANLGISCSRTWAAAPLPVGTFVSGTIDVYISAFTSGAPGILVDLFTNAALTTSTRETVPVTTPSATGVWQRVPFTARVDAGQNIYGIKIFLIGGYTAMTGGVFTGTVIFDSLTFALFDSSVDNTTVTIGADGALSGAGGGQVSITGLGYTGELNATKGATISRTYTIPTFATPSSLSLTTGVDAMTYSAGTLTKTGSTATWTSSGYSNTGIAVASGAAVVCTPEISSVCMIGLNNSLPSTSAGYADIDFAFYFAAGAFYIYESGVLIGFFGLRVAGDEFCITYSAGVATYYHNGIVINTTTVTALTGTLYLDSSFFTSASYVSGLQFGAYVAPTLVGYPNIIGQISPSNVSTFIANAAIGTAYIGNASITTAKIGDLAVDTLKIAGQAVTASVFANTDAGINLVVYVDVDVQTAVIVSTGAPIEIQFGCTIVSALLFDSSSALRWSSYANLFLYRDSTLIKTINNIIPLSTFFVKDIPGVGTFTYTLRVNSQFGTPSVINRYISLMEVKK